MRLFIFFVFSQYGLACKYGIIFQISVYHWMQNFIFLIPGTTTANQINLIFKENMFLDVFEVDFILKIKNNICLLFLQLTLNTKQGTAKERIHLFLFLKYIRKNLLKGK